MKHKLLMALALAATTGGVHAQPVCPTNIEVRVAASLLPDGRPLTVHAQWLADWQGVVSNARVDNVITGPDRPRGEMHPQLRRAIQHAIDEQVRCSPRAEGESSVTYPFVRDVTVRPGG
ncbi:MAG: hypothetical protein LC632_01485 [Xanthomonadaceae bacterium]|nr:hypothetical protein [Xanthomonadaceae bacterium]